MRLSISQTAELDLILLTAQRFFPEDKIQRHISGLIDSVVDLDCLPDLLSVLSPLFFILYLHQRFQLMLDIVAFPVYDLHALF